MIRWAATIISSLALASMVSAKPFDPRDHKHDFAGKPTVILVLGTPHLAGLPKAFTTDQLAPLLDRLAAWKPDVITIEGIAGEQCDDLRRYDALHPEAAKTYCYDLSAGRQATGLDPTAAILAAEKMLAEWPVSPTAAQRRTLAAYFLAGGEYASALVQWLRLPEAERKTGEGLDDALVKQLTKLQSARNENFSIGATLAARLGLERVYPTDDHTADNAGYLDPGYKPAFDRIWSGPKLAARRKAEAALNAKLGTPGAVMTIYRALNDPAEAKGAFDTDFGAALRDDTPKQYGRQYVAWWETRNLRMVANIRATMALKPGARVLTIVGSSHKGYFDAYLGMMHDVQLVDTPAFLR